MNQTNSKDTVNSRKLESNTSRRLNLSIAQVRPDIARPVLLLRPHRVLALTIDLVGSRVLAHVDLQAALAPTRVVFKFARGLLVAIAVLGPIAAGGGIREDAHVHSHIAVAFHLVVFQQVDLVGVEVPGAKGGDKVVGFRFVGAFDDSGGVYGAFVVGGGVVVKVFVGGVVVVVGLVFFVGVVGRCRGRGEERGVGALSDGRVAGGECGGLLDWHLDALTLDFLDMEVAWVSDVYLLKPAYGGAGVVLALAGCRAWIHFGDIQPTDVQEAV